MLPFIAPFLALVLARCALGLNNELYNFVKTTSYYANGAYCLEKKIPFDSTTGQVHLSKSGITVLDIYRPSDENKRLSGYGYLSVNHATKEFVISFRGSTTVEDWIADFAFLPPQDYQPLSGKAKCQGGCKIHPGPYEFFPSLYKEVMASFNKHRPKYKDYSLIVTGHSLGGGYAYLMGIELQTMGLKPTLVTYGGLRMGNAATNAFVDKLFNSQKNAELVKQGQFPRNSYFRFCQEYDIVPLAPPGPIYNHAGIMFIISGSAETIPQVKDITIMGYNPHLDELLPDIFLSGRILTLLRVLDHNKFFRRMAYPCLADSWVL